MQNDNRVQKIRANVQQERRLLLDLANKLSNEDVKRSLLGPPKSALDFVELGFLEPKILAEPRSQQELARWLDGAERFL